MVDFHRERGDPRRLSRGKLASLVHILDLRPDSYLTWARNNDVEIYRAAYKSGLLRESGKAKKPQGFEMTLSAEIAAANFLLLQQLIHVTARSRKKFRGKPWPAPETAADVVKRERADEGYQSLMSEIRFLPREEFEAHIAEHRSQANVVRKRTE